MENIGVWRSQDNSPKKPVDRFNEGSHSSVFADIDAQLLKQSLKEYNYSVKFHKRIRSSDPSFPLPVSDQVVYRFGERSAVRYRDGKAEVFNLVEHRFKDPHAWTPKQSRVFHRTFSGLQVGVNRGDFHIFSTFTTQYDQRGWFDKAKNVRVVKCEEDRLFNERMKRNALARAELELNNHFQVWKKSVCRHEQLRRFLSWFMDLYPNVDLFSVEGRRVCREVKKSAMYSKGVTFWKHFEHKMCYFKVRTLEGGGVIHALIRRSKNLFPFDVDFAKSEWLRIHGAKETTFEELEVDEEKPLKNALDTSFYYCGNYFHQQPVARASSSYDWIFHGAAAVWSRGKQVLGIKKRIRETFPSHICEDPVSQRDEVYAANKTDKPNVILKRESVVKLCFNARRSGRSDKEGCFDQAKLLWFKLLKMDHVRSRQVKLRKWF